MASTYLSLHYHIVLGTKDRIAFIDASWRTRLHEYLGGIVHGLGATPESIGGVADHVHLLVGLKSTHCLSDFVRDLKKAATAWMQETIPNGKNFTWQNGYAAFTVSATYCSAVREYISNQEEHHLTKSFRDECVTLFEKAGIRYDPKYLE